MTYTESHARLVTELLRELTRDTRGAIAGYNLGIGSSAAIASDLEPTREFLTAVMNAADVPAAVAIAREWVKAHSPTIEDMTREAFNRLR